MLSRPQSYVHGHTDSLPGQSRFYDEASAQTKYNKPRPRENSEEAPGTTNSVVQLLAYVPAQALWIQAWVFSVVLFACTCFGFLGPQTTDDDKKDLDTFR